jgi:MazG family protein
MDRLRLECPWDRKQTLRDLAGHLLEECYEVLEALEREDLEELEGELGDLLFQIVFLSRLGSESGAFTLDSVARRIEAKMVARHPHVFGTAQVKDAEAVRSQWEKLKEEERSRDGRGASSPFDGLPAALPALLKAARYTSRAADLGFDWLREADVLAKLDEEVAEFRQEALAVSPEAARLADEVGDVLFTVVNVARRHRVDPEAALQSSNAKFRRRFEEVVRLAKERGVALGPGSLEELDRLWDEVKRAESL